MSLKPESTNTNFNKYKVFNKINEDFELLFVGDTSFGENYQEQIPKENGGSILTQFGYEYPLEKVKSIMLRADFVVANLETPITNVKKSPFEGQKDYLHWTDIKKSPEILLKHNVSLVSLANNHSFDYGEVGFNQTLQILHDYEIPLIGAGKNINQAAEPFVGEINFGTKKFKFAIIAAFEELPSYRKKYHVYASQEKSGLMPLELDVICNQIKELKQSEKDIFVIVYPHWGSNYKWCDNDQIIISDALMNCGADLIIGHGAHMIQEVEKLHDKWIVYNIGNFMFNSPGRYEKMKAPPYSFVASMNVSLKDNEPSIYLKLYPIISDNKLTNYQPRFLNKNEFSDFIKLYSSRVITTKIEQFPINLKKDHIGFYIELPVLSKEIIKPVFHSNWIGMIYHPPKDKKEENYIYPWLARAFVIDKELEKHGFKLICYTPSNYNVSLKTVTGVMLEYGQFKPITIPIPKVNYNFHLGKSGREMYHEFESLVLENGIAIYPNKAARRATSDKILSFELISEYDKSLTPHTERFDGETSQLENFFKNSNKIFIKPRFGRMGNKIFVIKKNNNNYSLDFYTAGRKKSESFNSLSQCISFITKNINDTKYIAQEGIDILQNKGLVFVIRTVGFYIDQQWHFLNELISSDKNKDVSNLYQGGAFHHTDEFLKDIFSPKKITTIFENIKSISTSIANHLNIKLNNSINEIAFDFLIDKNGKPYIAELNVKPGLVGEPMKYSNYFLMDEEESRNYETLTVKHGELLAKSLLDKCHHPLLLKKPKTIKETYWFEDIKATNYLSSSDFNKLTKSIFSALEKQQYTLESLPKDLKLNNTPQMVFITASDSKTYTTYLGSGKNLLAALNAAMSLFRTLPKAFNLQIIKLDIVREINTLKHHNVEEPFTQDRSLQGIAFDTNIGLAYLPEEIIAHTIINSDNKLRVKSIQKAFTLSFEQNSLLSEANKFTIYRFKTQSNVSSKEITQPLFRGHLLFNEITPQRLLSAALFAGKYLQRAVKDNGDFAYEYLPKIDSESDRYNILRHAGSIYSMLELYEISPDETLMKAASLALSNLIDRAQLKIINNENLLCIVENGFVKLGANALALLALSKYIKITGNTSYIETAKKLARWIEHAQNASGEFILHKFELYDDKNEDFVSGYYPGEAIFSLLRFYQIDSNERWLTCAEKAANYIINMRDKNKKISELDHDHWLLYGLNELYRFKENPLYIKHSLKICQAILRAQNTKNEPIDYVGSFYNPPRSTPTAVRSEGLCAAYRLLERQGKEHEKESHRILEAIKLSIGFQLQTQFQLERALYLPNPSRTLGGFSKSLTDYSIRIDYVQHNLSSLIGLYNILMQRQ